MATAQTQRPTTHGCRDRSQLFEVSLKDEELVMQFLDGDEESSEAAFRAIVARHGPLVMGVCRHALHNEHDAEDAFQATFLTLSRKAETIRDRRVLSSWLYEVAYRIAIRARASAAKRRDREGQGAVLEAEATIPMQERTVALNDLQPVLHDEVNRLPEKYRLPIILSYLEGKSNEEVAELLEWPVGTVKGRLFRARNLLRSRLTRRGLVLSTSFLCMALGQGKVEGAVISDDLIERTVRLALRARLAESASASAPVEIGSPAHPSGSTGAAADAITAPKVRGKRKLKLEFLFILFALLSLGFAAYSYISTNPVLMVLLKRRLQWLAFWGANAC
jgi:RNA polymerase sigma factor (sigma-70 family)